MTNGDDRYQFVAAIRVLGKNVCGAVKKRHKMFNEVKNSTVVS